jgi:hypothetical protein
LPDAHKNFAYSTVAIAPSPPTTGGVLTVAVGDGTKLPAPPFQVVIWPTGVQPLTTNAEIARCTNVSTDQLSITRAQEGTSARSIVNGDQLAAAITVKALTDLETDIAAKVDKTTLTTKGDLYAATAASTPARQGVGANNTLLVADSAQATGLKWAQVADAMVLAGTNLAKLAAVTGTPDGTKFLRDDGAWQAAAGGGGGAATVAAVTQAAHGLAVGNIVRLSGASYVKAQADTAANAEVVGIVSAVADANNFTVTMSGRVTGLSGLTAGMVYFLDASTAGSLTATEPNLNGQISKPLLVADAATSGYFYNFRGMVIGGGILAPTMQVLTAASGTYTTPVGCRAISVEVYGGGGGSGGASVGGGDGAYAGGGGAGGYARKQFAVSGATAYSYGCGAGGAAGVAGGANGGNGGNSTFTVGAVTVTASGGAGSATVTTNNASEGGAGGVGTNGDLNATGAPGGGGFRQGAAAGCSGYGGSSAVGGGGLSRTQTQGGAAASGYGAGAGGARCTSGSQPGAAGSQGVIIVAEFY